MRIAIPLAFASLINLTPVLEAQSCPPVLPNVLSAEISMAFDQDLDVRLEDFDEDGDEDLLYFTFRNPAATIKDAFLFFRNDIRDCPVGDTGCYFKEANDQWLAPMAASFFNKIYDVYFADVDHDGDYDMILGASPGVDLVFVWSGGKFQPPRPLDASCPTIASCPSLVTTGMYPADFDDDGDYDVAVVYRDTPGRLYLNDGTGFFTQFKKFQIPAGEVGLANAGAGNRDIVAADFDRDGDLDVAVARMEFSPWTPPSLGVLVYRNDGLGAQCDDRQGGQTPFCFWYVLNDEAGESPPAVSNTFTLTTVDIDNDGDVDVLQPVLNAYNGRSKLTRVYLNDGSGHLGGNPCHTPDTFIGIPNDPALPNQRARVAATADLDRDGDEDVILAHNGVNRIWLNEGTVMGLPTFSLYSSIAPTGGPGTDDNTRYFRFGDLDMNGVLDYCESNFGAATSRIFLNPLSE